MMMMILIFVFLDLPKGIKTCYARDFYIKVLYIKKCQNHKGKKTPLYI